MGGLNMVFYEVFYEYLLFDDNLLLNVDCEYFTF